MATRQINLMKNNYHKIFELLGCGLIVLVAINLFSHVEKWNDWGEILWFCNFATIVLGVSLILKKIVFINSVLIAAIPAQILWILDFFLNLFGTGLGRTSWLFEDAGLFVFILSTIFHAALIPISLYATLKIGFYKKSYIYSVIVFDFVMMSLSYFFTDFRENRNCIFYPCDIIYYKNPDLILSNSFYNSNIFFLKEVFVWMILSFITYQLLLFAFRKRVMVGP